MHMQEDMQKIKTDLIRITTKDIKHICILLRQL